MPGAAPPSPDPPAPNTYWVVPGHLAAGEYPGDLNPSKAARKVGRLLDAGIDHFIDLTHPADRMAPYARIAEQETRRRGGVIAYERRPIVDVSVPDRPEQMAGILDAIDSAVEEGRTVYVHCWGGVGRTGTVVGCWLVRHGHTGEEALRQLARWWRRVPKSRYHPRSPQTPEQHDYVRRWAEPTPEKARD